MNKMFSLLDDMPAEESLLVSDSFDYLGWVMLGSSLLVSSPVPC